jgi:hypothetical protein
MKSDYEQHYMASKKNSNISNKESKYGSLYDLSIDTECITMTDEYKNLISAISKKINNKFNNKHACLDARFVTYVNAWRDIEEIEQLANLIFPEIERNIFHSKLKVEFVLPYRNKTNLKNLEASWLWHYDDCPKEFVKLGIYLNETSEDNGCFQYVTGKDSVPVIPTSRLYVNADLNPPRKFARSRVPGEYIEEIISQEGEVKSLTGPPGTYFLFTPNIIHRATEPKPGTLPREALFFFIRPSVEQGKYIDEKTCSIKGNQKKVKRYVMD